MTTPERSRRDIARGAAEALEALGPDRCPRALVGFDGFVDAIVHLVDERRSMEPDDFSRIASIPEFAARIGAAAGKSANIEVVVREERFGGNGPLLASAMSGLGAGVTYIGAVGRADDHTELHPLYRALADRCREVIPIAPPAHTDALEFDDGKIMLGRPQNVQRVTWDRIKETVGLERIIDIVDGAGVLGVVNWVMVAGVEGIWTGLCDEVFPRLRSDAPRVFIDLCDPARRSDADVLRATEMLVDMNRRAPVTLGLNLAEAQRVARVVGVEAFDDSHNMSMASAVSAGRGALRERLTLDCVVVHPREGAAGADASGASAWFDGPFTRRPRLSTGAGDHFNGGFAFARAAGLDLEQSLAVGCATSGAYVRDAETPTRERLVGFLRDLPAGIR